MYEGQYKNDKKDGYGLFVWASGNTYRGQFKNDERDGKGEMRWTDGSVYVGDWNKGIQHGIGKMIFADGTIVEGYFDNNRYIAPLNISTKEEVSSPNDCSFNQKFYSLYPNSDRYKHNRRRSLFTNKNPNMNMTATKNWSSNSSSNSKLQWCNNAYSDGRAKQKTGYGKKLSSLSMRQTTHSRAFHRIARAKLVFNNS